MTTPFHLFSLPYVPLKQVLDNIGSEALLLLSMCSLRSKSIAVSYRGPSKNVRLKLHFGSYDYLEDSNYSYMTILLMVGESGKLLVDPNTMETVRMGSFEKVPVVIERHFVKGVNLITFWEDRMTGLTEIGDYAREVFNQDIYEVYISDKQGDDDHRRVAEWVAKSPNSFQRIHCEFKPKIDSDLDFILENFKYTKELAIDVQPSEHYSPARMPSFQIDSLLVYYSFWIKRNHLLAMNCKVISLEESNLSSRDLNAFLKHWIAGGCSQLKELYVHVQQPIDYQIVLGRVKFRKRRSDLERVYAEDERTSHTIKGGFDVKRSNVTATVVGHDVERFWMIVW